MIICEIIVHLLVIVQNSLYYFCCNCFVVVVVIVVIVAVVVVPIPWSKLVLKSIFFSVESSRGRQLFQPKCGQHSSRQESAILVCVSVRRRREVCMGRKQDSVNPAYLAHERKH